MKPDIPPPPEDPPFSKADFKASINHQQRTDPKTRKRLVSDRQAPLPDAAAISNGALKRTVIAILALQLNGLSHAEIGQQLGLAALTVGKYLNLAGRRGLIPTKTHLDPKDRIDHVLTHKVLDNLEDGLTATELVTTPKGEAMLGPDGKPLTRPDVHRRDRMALKMAEGTIFKAYDHDKANALPPTNVLAIKIETTGSAAPLRDGTGGGTPRYIEGETEDE